MLKILEELNTLMEDELVDNFTDVDIEDTTLDIAPVSNLSLTDELDAKARISRALDFLKASIETFKSATLTEIDLIKDTVITSAMENLDNAVSEITQALGGKLEPTLQNQEELDFVNTTEEEPEDTEVESDLESEEETESEDDEEEDEEETEEEETEEEPDFEEEAELDLFK